MSKQLLSSNFDFLLIFNSPRFEYRDHIIYYLNLLEKEAYKNKEIQKHVITKIKYIYKYFWKNLNNKFKIENTPKNLDFIKNSFFVNYKNLFTNREKIAINYIDDYIYGFNLKQNENKKESTNSMEFLILLRSIQIMLKCLIKNILDLNSSIFDWNTYSQNLEKIKHKQNISFQLFTNKSDKTYYELTYLHNFENNNKDKQLNYTKYSIEEMMFVIDWYFSYVYTNLKKPNTKQIEEFYKNQYKQKYKNNRSMASVRMLINNMEANLSKEVNFKLGAKKLQSLVKEKLNQTKNHYLKIDWDKILKPKFRHNE